MTYLLITKSDSQYFSAVGLYFFVHGQLQELNNVASSLLTINQTRETLVGPNARGEAAYGIFQVDRYLESAITVLYLTVGLFVAIWQLRDGNNGLKRLLLWLHRLL